MNALALKPTSARPVVLGPDGRPYRPAEATAYRAGVRRAWRSGYDAARTTDINRRHWAGADALSAEAAAGAGVRRTLRNRARYEVANNSWLGGMVTTYVDYCIGRGPRLQFDSGDETANKKVEHEFRRWAKAVRLAKKMRTARRAKLVDGEAFLMMTFNPKVRHAVQLDIVPIEADRVTDPTMSLTRRNECDGIVFDEYGNPISYRVLRSHPGDSWGVERKYDMVAADKMIHLFDTVRAGQRRGITEFAASLTVAPELRRFSRAVVLAAEWAASMHGWLYTDNPANDEDAKEGEPWETIEVEANMLTVAPAGYKAMQMKAEQPVATHNDFVKGKLNEAARPLSMPLNIAMCNSSDYNYASGRLDHQTFYVRLSVDRGDIEQEACDEYFDAWMIEAQLIPGLLPPLSAWSQEWMWPGFPHADPEKEARALDILLKNGGETLANWYAKQGRDARSEMEIRLREREELPVEAGREDPQALDENGR